MHASSLWRRLQPGLCPQLAHAGWSLAACPAALLPALQGRGGYGPGDLLYSFLGVVILSFGSVRWAARVELGRQQAAAGPEQGAPCVQLPTCRLGCSPPVPQQPSTA